MVVVLWVTDGIASANTSPVELTDELQFGQYLQSAVNGHQPDLGVLLMYPAVYGSRSKVVLAGGNCPYHRPPLWGELIAMTV